MKARLKVLSGSSSGKELRLKEGQFLIGRSDSCHLRPRSDAVSRKHCILLIDDAEIRVRDLKSRNGTLVNGERIQGDVVLTSGDKLNVGPLEFEVHFTTETTDAASSAVSDAPVKPVAPSQPPAPKSIAAGNTAGAATSKAKAVAGAKAKGGKAAGNIGDEDIFSWLEEADEVDREQRMADPTTRQFKNQPGEEDPSKETVDIAKADGKSSDTSIEKKEKKEPGKLPPAPDKASENSQDAAADALRQFFKRS